MRWSRSRRDRRGRTRADEEGATVVELVVAAGLTLVAAALVVPTVIVPLAHASDRLEARVGHARLEAAAETFARAVRAARPRVDGPAASVLPRSLTLAMSTVDGPATTRMDLSDDGLRIVTTGPGAAAVGLPTAVHLDGLDLAASHFAPVAEAAGGSDGEVHAVTLRLSGADGRIERTVRLRVVHPLHGVQR